MKQGLSLVAKKCRRTVTKAGLATLVFNKVPVTHFIVHEARLAGTIGLSQVVKWSVATVAGLGAYDAVSGATVITQLAPSVGSSTVPAEAGELLNFIYQVTGRDVEADSWEVEGATPCRPCPPEFNQQQRRCHHGNPHGGQGNFSSRCGLTRNPIIGVRTRARHS